MQKRPCRAQNTLALRLQVQTLTMDMRVNPEDQEMQ